MVSAREKKMKVLLTVFATMMITGTAMADACKVAQDCTTEKECKDLDSKNTFNEKAPVKCMVPVSAVATNCTQGNDSTLPVADKERAAPKKDETGKAATNR